MSSRRVLKVAEAIRQVVSMAILAELNDPRVQDVTVTSVSVSPDLRKAEVNVSVMGSENKQRLALRGLQSSAGYLQSKIANRIDTRYTPVLEFVLDPGVKKSIEIAKILRDVLPHQQGDSEDSIQDDSSDDSDAIGASESGLGNKSSISDKSPGSVKRSE